MTNVLITGIGGTNSIAVLKALRGSGVAHRAVGTDRLALTAGSALVDRPYVVPPVADAAAYDAALAHIIRREAIAIVFATTETELAHLARVKDQVQAESGAVVVAPDPAVLQTCQDKLATQQFLREHGFIHLPTVMDADPATVRLFAARHGFPLVRKPVTGYGSRGVSVVDGAAELEGLGYTGTHVLQVHAAGGRGSSAEYTTEVFVNADGSVAGGIVIERVLVHGESVRGRVVRDDAAVAYLTDVARSLGVRGPCNFQYLVRDGLPHIFEINARYSGTTAVRAHFGFNSVGLALQSFLEGDHATIAPDDIGEGPFVRYWEEAYPSG